MLFHTLLDPRSGVDIEQLVCELREPLETADFQRAWRSVVARHPVLRTNLRWENPGRPCQEVRAAVDLPWEEQDWRGIADRERERRIADFLSADRLRGFDLARAPLFRLTLLRHGEAEFDLIWTFHHAVLEGRSYVTALREVFAFYEAFRAGREITLPLPRPYRDYIDWLQRQDFSKDETFWRQALKGFTAPTPLVVDHVPDSHRHVRAGHGNQELRLSAQITSVLVELVRDHQLSLNAVVQGAWALLLSRYSGETDVVFGVIRGNRRATIEGAEAMIGLFLNTLPLRVQVDPEAALLPWLQDLRARWTAMRGHEHTPLVKVQGWSDVPGGISLFQSTVMFENSHLDAGLREQGGAWSNRRFRLFLQTNYLVDLAAFGGAELRLRIDFNRSRIDDDAAGRMLGHLRTLLESIALQPQRKLGELPMLNMAERHQLLVEWNRTDARYARNPCIHELFETQVERTPEAIAVEFEGQRLTYDELNRRSNQLAHHLRSLGVGPEALVGICAERSLETVTGLLGILKAGGAYVPFDPTYPAERVEYMLRDAGASVVLAQQDLIRKLPALRAVNAISLDASDRRTSPANDVNLPRIANDANLAYVIYTSGSSGRPKGAMIPHRAIVNHLLWMQATFPLDERDRVLQKTEFSFDVSAWECFGPLIAGARLVVARPGGHRDPRYLADAIIRHDVTILQLVPSLLRMLLAFPRFKDCGSLRHVFCGGEAMTEDIPRKFFATIDAELHNMYGPTEVAIDSVCYAVPRDNAGNNVPIGRPVANTRAYVLDRHRQPVPVGVPGELYLGGIQVGRGYRNQPELTAERFLPDDFSDAPGALLYRTGDQVRFLPDGNIAFLGRMDHQVKVRGFRIEPGEIEAEIARHPAIRDAVVVAREDVPGDARLVAYVVAGNPPADLFDQARALVRARLPEYMVPGRFVRMEALPLSPNGKVDRESLPNPSDRDGVFGPAAYVAPRNDLEKSFARAWERVLEVPRVGITDNFFDLGGNSLSALNLVLEMEQAAGIDIDLGEVFRSPTVSGLVASLGPDAEKNASVVVPLQREGNGLPVFCICGIDIYRQFAQSLGQDQPVYGVYVAEEQAISRQVIRRKRPEISVRRLVEAYGRAIARFCPRGPYRLVGLSFGGLLAMELASSMRRRGAEVEVVMLLDAALPGAVRLNWRRWLAHQTTKIINAGASGNLLGLWPALRDAYARLRSKTEVRNRYVDEEFVNRQRAGFGRAARKWQAHRSMFDFRVILFRASEHSTWGPYSDFDEDYGWRRYVGDRLGIVDVTGTHRGIIETPNVAALGLIARQYLESRAPEAMRASADVPVSRQ